jgi:hypothetical protein
MCSLKVLESLAVKILSPLLIFPPDFEDVLLQNTGKVGFSDLKCKLA